MKIIVEKDSENLIGILKSLISKTRDISITICLIDFEPARHGEIDTALKDRADVLRFWGKNKKRLSLFGEGEVIKI